MGVFELCLWIVFYIQLHLTLFNCCVNLVAGDVTNIILDPIFIFSFRLGVSGAAIAHVISQ